MPAIVDKFLSRFGYSRGSSNALARRKDPDVPIINDQVRNPGNKPEIRVWQLSAQGAPLNWGWPSGDYNARVKQGYQYNSDVYACISLIATAAKQVKWWDGTTKAKSDAYALVKAIGLDTKSLESSAFPEKRWKQALDPRATIDLLKKSGGATFIEQWVSYILLSGNAYMEPIIPAKGRIDHVYVDSPGLVTAYKINRKANHSDEMVEVWRVSNGYGDSRLLQPFTRNTAPAEGASIVQSKLFNPIDQIYGMAPLEAALLRVALQNESARYGKLAFERGFVPGWIEARQGSDWDDTQVASLKEKIRKSKAAGEELFLENALWHDNGIKPGESAMTEIHLLSKRDIASVYHVDPALIGDTSSRTYATYRESRRGLYMEAVIPLLTQFKDDWNRTLGAELQSPLDFDKDSFDAIAFARDEAADRVTKLWQVGLITQDEARKDMEYDPAKPGDVFYAPASLVPLGETAEEPE